MASSGAADALIGALLINPSAFDTLDVSVSDFVVPWQRSLFETIGNMIRNREHVDATTVAATLERKRMTAPGGKSWYDLVADIVEVTISAANIDAYASIVRREGQARRSDEAVSAFGQSEKQAEDRERLIRQLMEIDDTQRTNSRHLADDLPDFIDLIDRLQAGEKIGLPTGIPRLDAYMGGFIPGDLTVIAARSSVGKTAMMCNHSVALPDHPHLIFSTEQPARQILQRYCAIIAEVNAQNIRLGDLSQKEWHDLETKALTQIKKMPIYINDSSRITIEEITREARKYKFLYGIEAVFVDHLHRVRTTKYESRVEQLSDIARELKNMARELDISVIALAQLNRELERRQDHRPTLADLKGSGGIEEEADNVFALYRPAMYEDTADARTLELILLKNRHGPLGTTKVDFYAEIMKIRPRAARSDALPGTSQGYFDD